MGMAMIWCGCVEAAESRLSRSEMADSLLSVNRNASLTLGGEVRTDYSFRRFTTDYKRDPDEKGKIGDLSLRNVNLRLLGRFTPSVGFSFKLDFTDSRPEHLSDDIFEEALLVMNAVGGTGFGITAGLGRAPYGQDISLGMLQSYHHAANQADSSEGLIHIIDPPRVENRFRPDIRLDPMRPGQMIRTALIGVSYQTDGSWKAELAAFQPEREEYDARLRPGKGGSSGVDIGVAGRLWWAPVEDLTLELSALLSHSTDMGHTSWRGDLAPGAKATQNAYAVSAGFDWRPGDWRVFGEYQHAWDWNFSRGYDTDTAQLGAAWYFRESWRLGGMIEGMRIRNPAAHDQRDEYAKFAVNLRHDFTPGVFILFEYGHEWVRQKQKDEMLSKRRGHFLGMRIGLSF